MLRCGACFMFDFRAGREVQAGESHRRDPAGTGGRAAAACDENGEQARALHT